MNRALPTVMGLALAFAGCAGADDTPPASPFTEGWAVAYNVLVDEADDDYEVFVIDAPGAEPRNLTRHPGVDWVYAALEDTLYFVSDRDTAHRTYFLYAMRSDGSGLRRVYDRPVADAWPAVSALGHGLVLSTWLDDGTPALLRTTAGGRVTDTLLATRAFAFGSAAWAADDSLVVFRSEESGLDELWVMPPDGAWRQRLSNYPDTAASADDHVYHAGPPRWSPAHGWISAMSHRGGEYDIHLYTPHGTWIRRLTPLGSDEGWHDWSPDGHWLAYDATPLPSDTTVVNYNIVIADVRAGVERRERAQPAPLTSDPRPEQAPVFVRQAGR